MVARLKDVAARAGVSVKTASNVVNKQPHVAPGTRARVEAAIAELRYRPNLSARELKFGRTGFLALALPELEMPYFAELASRIVAIASEHDRLVLLDDTRADPAAETMVCEGMRTHVIDGMIFSPLALDAARIAARRDEVPMVLLGERAVPPGFDHVAVDSVEAAEAATAHLIGMGRRRIAAIGWESRQGTASVRHQGYRRALAAAGIDYDPHLVIGVPRYQRAEGRRAMESLLELATPPDAVFCFNDMLAVGALKHCAEAGIEVPDDIAIMGFDDVSEASYTNPTLSTVSVDTDRLAREAVRLLLRRIEDRQVEPERITVGWQLRLRQSTEGRRRPCA